MDDGEAMKCRLGFQARACFSELGGWLGQIRVQNQSVAAGSSMNQKHSLPDRGCLGVRDWGIPIRAGGGGVFIDGLLALMALEAGTCPSHPTAQPNSD
jgi:hypothetical protein